MPLSPGDTLAVETVSPMARLRYVLYFLLPCGHLAEAIEQSRLAIETDPLSMPLQMAMTLTLEAERQPLTAIAHCRQALEIDASFYLIWLLLGASQLDADLPLEAVFSLERAVKLGPWHSMAWGLLAAACHRAGDQERSREALQILSGQQGNAYGKATYCAVVGKTDAMFAALDQAYQQRDWNLRSITSFASYDPYRADPRYHALLAKMNLA